MRPYYCELMHIRLQGDISLSKYHTSQYRKRQLRRDRFMKGHLWLAVRDLVIVSGTFQLDDLEVKESCSSSLAQTLDIWGSDYECRKCPWWERCDRIEVSWSLPSLWHLPISSRIPRNWAAGTDTSSQESPHAVPVKPIPITFHYGSIENLVKIFSIPPNTKGLVLEQKKLGTIWRAQSHIWNLEVFWSQAKCYVSLSHISRILP